LFETRSLPALDRRSAVKVYALSRKSFSSVPVFLIQQSCRSSTFGLRRFQNIRDIRVIRGLKHQAFTDNADGGAEDQTECTESTKSIETLSAPALLGATHRAFAFYLGNPISSIPAFLLSLFESV